jgi:hypothetical protein
MLFPMIKTHKYSKYQAEREANFNDERLVSITIRTRAPSKWRFVDLETSQSWMWDGSQFKQDDYKDSHHIFIRGS